MNVVLKCPKCRNNAKYVPDTMIESKGMYAFDCECGEQFMSPMENPNIENVDEIKHWEDLDLDLNVGTSAEQLEEEILAEVLAKIASLDLSQRDLADKTGLKQPAIARLFKAETSPQLNTLCKLIEPFGYTLKMIKKD